MKRREFVAGLGGAAAVWPLAARAQQGDRVRRIGVLLNENAPVATPRASVFRQALRDLGWADGRNVWVDVRWVGADTNRIRGLAQELVGLQPDIILTFSTAATVALQRETRTIPIVFVNVADPVASGIVPRLDRPGGNITGFAGPDATVEGKRLELLSEITPGLKRCAIMFNPTRPPHRLICPQLRRRPGHSRSSRSLRPFTATQRSKRPSSPLGASREAAFSSWGGCVHVRASRVDHIGGGPKQRTGGLLPI
jgi:putative ABC transport system substrate-binding protein